MGTRADFYVGRGVKAAWLGSIAWDGYPDGIDDIVLEATDEKTFRYEVEKFIAGRKDGTKPEQGWPWPWVDSQTTDFAYAFDDGKVFCSCFGHAWYDPVEDAKLTDEEREAAQEGREKGKVAVFPNMKSRQKVTLGTRSGVTVLGATPDGQPVVVGAYDLWLVKPEGEFEPTKPEDIPMFGALHEPFPGVEGETLEKAVEAMKKVNAEAIGAKRFDLWALPIPEGKGVAGQKARFRTE